ncbi:MAG: hypothetical protein QGF25_06925 [Candidatus Woesearchaeota archaeon]|nr:hypothetical protein [Candidatus Woesearchaeota archaeon]
MNVPQNVLKAAKLFESETVVAIENAYVAVTARTIILFDKDAKAHTRINLTNGITEHTRKTITKTLVEYQFAVEETAETSVKDKMADLQQAHAKNMRTVSKQSQKVSEPTEEELGILQDTELLPKIIKEAQKKISGEKEAIKTIHLCAAGRNVKNNQIASYNLLVNAESSSGKDFIVKHALAILPDHERVMRSRISPTAFTYWHNANNEPDWTWDKKVCVLQDISTPVLNSETFKLMCSDGNSSTITVNNEAVDIEINGKPVMVCTTATSTPNAEMLTRFAILTLDETQDQTKEIIRKQARAAAKGITIHKDETLSSALNKLKRVSVVIPYAPNVSEFFPTKHVAMRRHFPRFLDFIKASASLHQYQRQKQEDGSVIATGKDYDIAREVIVGMASNPHMVSITSEQQKILDTFKKLTFSQTIQKFRCEECNMICDKNACPRCKYPGAGYVPVQAAPVKLTSFSVRDIIPHLTFYTKTEKMLYLCLANLVKDGFLKTSNVKRSGINQEVVTYSLVETQELDFPTWETICRNITKVKEVTEGKEVTIVTQVGELA